MSAKITERQQIKLWIDTSDIHNKSEETIDTIFKIAMEYKKTHPNVTLKQSYSYAYMVYINKHAMEEAL